MKPLVGCWGAIITGFGRTSTCRSCIHCMSFANPVDLRHKREMGLSELTCRAPTSFLSSKPPRGGLEKGHYFLAEGDCGLYLHFNNKVNTFTSMHFTLAGCSHFRDWILVRLIFCSGSNAWPHDHVWLAAVCSSGLSSSGGCPKLLVIVRVPHGQVQW